MAPAKSSPLRSAPAPMQSRSVKRQDVGGRSDTGLGAKIGDASRCMARRVVPVIGTRFPMVLRGECWTECSRGRMREERVVVMVRARDRHTNVPRPAALLPAAEQRANRQAGLGRAAASGRAVGPGRGPFRAPGRPRTDQGAWFSLRRQGAAKPSLLSPQDSPRGVALPIGSPVPFLKSAVNSSEAIVVWRARLPKHLGAIPSQPLSNLVPSSTLDRRDGPRSRRRTIERAFPRGCCRSRCHR
jgi:hypothetical protein